MLRILIVEDHPETRAWLAALAEEAFPGSENAEAGTLERARELVAQERFNLALIDISLPDGSGIDLLDQLARDCPETYGVVATIFDDDRHVFAALQAGAKGYVLKDQPRERLIEQLRGIARGEPPLSPGVARRILRFFQREPEAATIGERPTLSERESEVLKLLSRGYSRKEIARALDITPNTAAGYVKAIYVKLRVSGRAEAALEAVKLGLIDPRR